MYPPFPMALTSTRAASIAHSGVALGGPIPAALPLAFIWLAHLGPVARKKSAADATRVPILASSASSHSPDAARV